MKKAPILLGAMVIMFSCGSSQKKQTTATNEQQGISPVSYANSITSQELKEALYTYASDEFEGRETGQPGQKKAVEYLRNQYVSMGIPSPIAPNDYFQEVPLEIVEVPEVELSINGKSFNMLEDFVSLLSSETGHLSSDEIIYAGYGIEDDAYSSYDGLDVTGKVVLIKSGEPKNVDGSYVISNSKKPSKWSKYNQEIAFKREAAITKGAKAVLFYYPESFKRSVSIYGKSRSNMTIKGKASEMYYLMIDDKLANAILPNIETESKSKTLKIHFELNYQNNSKSFTSENVLAFIRGSEKPNEVLVISAHLDHEGVKNGKVYNGADDDGSGTVSILEIAEAFKAAVDSGHTPKRSILFLHVTGEEKGLLGSQYYTDFDPIIPLKDIVADLNIDMIGRVDSKHENSGRNYLYLIGSNKLSTELHELSEEINDQYTNIDFDYTYNDDNDPNRFYYRSDHYNFAKNNIPVIFYFNGTHADYHQPTDTPDKIRYDLMEERARLIFYTAWEIANRDGRLEVDKAE